MSDKKEKEEKIVTKYDRKMQRRQEEKERQKKEERISRITGILIVAAIAALVAYFPIRTYLATNETYVTIHDEKVTKAEFDYNYNLVKNSYSGYLSYFGVDTTQDLSTQMYSDTMSWKDFFEEMTVENLKSAKALKALADSGNFTYDASAEIANFKASIKEQALAAGMREREYLKNLYGSYATMNQVSKYLAESIRENAYYEELSKSKAASDEEIQSYYEENTDDYDSVDYYVQTFEANMPTAPTELAETKEMPADGTAYVPSEAEVNKAMEDAKALAETAKLNLAKIGELRENVKKASVPYAIESWLFEETRKPGDTAVIEDTYSDQYYAVSFVNRYLDETPTANLRAILTTKTDGQVILNEWKNGAATEESFIELCKKYSEDNDAITKGGLFEGIAKNGISEELADWIFASERSAGDTTALALEDGYHYVLYYLGEGRPEWKNSIAETLLNQTMQAYIEEIAEKITVEDKKGNLNYLKARAAEEAAADSSSEDTDAQSTEESGTAQDVQTP